STENASSFQSLLSRLTNSDNTENSICSQIDSSMDANPENIMSTDIAELILANGTDGWQYDLLSEKLVPGTMMMNALFPTDDDSEQSMTDWMSGLAMFGNYSLVNALQNLNDGSGVSENSLENLLLGINGGDTENITKNLFDLSEFALFGNDAAKNFEGSGLMEVLARQTLQGTLQSISDSVLTQAKEGKDVSGILSALEGMNASDDTTGILTNLKNELAKLQEAGTQVKTEGTENFNGILTEAQNGQTGKTEKMAAQNSLAGNSSTTISHEAGNARVSEISTESGNFDETAIRSKANVENFDETVQQNAPAMREVSSGADAAQGVQPQKEEAAGYAQPYSQIADEVVSRLEQKGDMHFRMQLEPENLGTIDVEMKISEGKLMIDIMSHLSGTHQLLSSQVDRLITSLGLQNVQVESITVDSGSSVKAIESEAAAMNTGNFDRDAQRENGQDAQKNRQNRITSMIDSNEDLSDMTDFIGMMRDGSRKMDYMV
ncbi:MAG: flagellar hook-length control protein FliK, partial [Clostridia bacterium]|nr:flagellar hook-length control protein FliK [Clostridia bacterium]